MHFLCFDISNQGGSRNQWHLRFDERWYQCFRYAYGKCIPRQCLFWTVGHSQYFTTRVLVNGSKFRAAWSSKSKQNWMPPFWMGWLRGGRCNLGSGSKYSCHPECLYQMSVTPADRIQHWEPNVTGCPVDRGSLELVRLGAVHSTISRLESNRSKHSAFSGSWIGEWLPRRGLL